MPGRTTAPSTAGIRSAVRASVRKDPLAADLPACVRVLALAGQARADDRRQHGHAVTIVLAGAHDELLRPEADVLHPEPCAREELADLRRPQLLRGPLAVRHRVPSDPGDVCVLRAAAQMAGARGVRHAVEEAWPARRRGPAFLDDWRPTCGETAFAIGQNRVWPHDRTVDYSHSCESRKLRAARAAAGGGRVRRAPRLWRRRARETRRVPRCNAQPCPPVASSLVRGRGPQQTHPSSTTHGTNGSPESSSLPVAVMSSGRSRRKPATPGRLHTIAISWT